MWVFSERGFYSAVEKYEDRAEGMVTIRSRNKADLDRLTDLIDAKPYRKNGYTDYPWRIRCPKEQWAAAMYEMASTIDYPNFKDRIKLVLGGHRASVYGRVWGVLLDLESSAKKFKQSSFTGFSGVTLSQTDGKCRDCKQKAGDKHDPDCMIWPGYTVIPGDCTVKSKRSRNGSRKRSSKRSKSKVKS